MRLKSIRIFGFKSFADKIEIDVDDNLLRAGGLSRVNDPSGATVRFAPAT